MRQSVKPVDNTFGYLGLNWRFAAYLPAQSYGRVQTIPTIVNHLVHRSKMVKKRSARCFFR